MPIKYIDFNLIMNKIFLILITAFVLTVFHPAKAICAEQKCILTGIIKSADTLKTIEPLKIAIKVNKKPVDIIFTRSREYKIKLKPGKNFIEISSQGYENCTFEVEFSTITNHENIKYKNIELLPEEKLSAQLELYDRITTSPVADAEIKIGKIKFKTNEAGFSEITFSKNDKNKTVKINAAGYRPLKVKLSELIDDKKEQHALYLERYTFYNAIHGTIAEKGTHEPIYGAIIEISGARAISDNEGKFILESLKSGKSLLKCSADGYETIEKKIDIAIKDNQILIYLKKAKDKRLNKKLNK